MCGDPLNGSASSMIGHELGPCSSRPEGRSFGGSSGLWTPSVGGVVAQWAALGHFHFTGCRLEQWAFTRFGGSIWLRAGRGPRSGPFRDA
jgi:hypothetical protein